MKINIRMGDGRVHTFRSLAELGKFYGAMGDAFRSAAMRDKTQRAARFNEGKAQAYDAVCWAMCHAESGIDCEDVPAPVEAWENIGSTTP